MFYRVYRFLGSASGLFEGLFDEVAGSEVADCEELLLKELFKKVLTVKLLLKWLFVKGLVVKGMVWKRIFNLRSTHDVAMNIPYI